MKRSMETTATSAVITTTNGATTTTGMLYARELREYTPLANGFNRELADHVIDWIFTHGGKLWNQGAWREIFLDGIDYEAEGLPSTLDTGYPCGTAMCFAGWVSELAGADHVIDGRFITAAAGDESKGLGILGNMEDYEFRYMADSYNDYALVRRDDPTFEMYLRHGSGTYPHSENILDYLEARGFSRETHTTLTLATYAAVRLGIVDYVPIPWLEGEFSAMVDHRELFDGTNSFARVKAIVDVYTEFGCPSGDSSLTAVQTRRKQIMLEGRDEAMRAYSCEISGDHLEIANEIDRVSKELLAEGKGLDHHEATLPAWALEIGG